MNLTESQLFTIEALNRIEGFVWPDDAEFASYDRWSSRIDLWSHDPELRSGGFYGQYILIKRISVESANPDWRNSLITREQFESVDGWVRSEFNGNSPVENGVIVDVEYADWVIGVNIPVGVIDYAGKSKCGEFNNCAAYEWKDIRKWRYHKPQKEKGMTLLEILVRELPKRGGWPDFAESCVQGTERRINFIGIGHGAIYRKNNEWECDSSNYNDDVDFHGEQLAIDHATKIVTRAEYEAAVNNKKVINAGEVKITLPGKVHQTEIKATVGMDEQQSIEQLYDEYRKVCIKLGEAKETVACSTAQRDEALAKIKSWHKERGFDVSEVKPISADSEVAKAMVDFLLPKEASDEVRNKAPFGSTHYDGEYVGRYLQRIGESWMMYVKGDWIKCDPDEQVLLRLMII